MTFSTGSYSSPNYNFNLVHVYFKPSGGWVRKTVNNVDFGNASAPTGVLASPDGSVIETATLAEAQSAYFWNIYDILASGTGFVNGGNAGDCDPCSFTATISDGRSVNAKLNGQNLMRRPADLK